MRKAYALIFAPIGLVYIFAYMELFLKETNVINTQNLSYYENTRAFIGTALWNNTWSDSFPLVDDPYRWSPYGVNGSRQWIPKNLAPIPPIIHQYWDTYNVPAAFVSWVKTWVELNPGYEYWFWTPDDVRALIDDHWPEYRALYDSYNHNQSRANVGRYLIMSAIGGFYGDLDVDCLRPLEPWRSSACIFSEETYLHSFLLHGREEPSVMNTVLGCHPQHPFYSFLPSQLEAEFKKYPKDVLKQCGVWYFDKMYRQFTQNNNNQNNNEVSNTFILVLHPKYFLPTYDPAYSMWSECRKVFKPSQVVREVCNDLKTNDQRTPYPESYTNHHWVHVIVNEHRWRAMAAVPIHEVVPRAKTYRDIITGVQTSTFYAVPT